MNIFKEIWNLGKLFFISKPKDIEIIEYMEMTHFPMSGYKYMMWCGKLIYRSSKKSRIMSELGTTRNKIDITHETYHLRQAQVKGSWFKFYISYLWQWIKGNPLLKPFESAYYTIPYEIEAYAKQNSMICPDKNNYVDYDIKNKYNLKHRKSIYIEHRKDWKSWIRTL